MTRRTAHHYARPGQNDRFSDRRALIAKVHVAKKQLGIDEDTYRAVMLRITGKTSAADCSTGELTGLLAAFETQGFQPTTKISRKSWVRLIWSIWQDIVPLLDGDASDAALASFVARQTASEKNPAGIVQPEWLDAAEAKKVIEGLKGWRTRLQTAAKGEVA